MRFWQESFASFGGKQQPMALPNPRGAGQNNPQTKPQPEGWR
jgi:hypothetical protein